MASTNQMNVADLISQLHAVSLASFHTSHTLGMGIAQQDDAMELDTCSDLGSVFDVMELDTCVDFGNVTLKAKNPFSAVYYRADGTSEDKDIPMIDCRHVHHDQDDSTHQHYYMEYRFACCPEGMDIDSPASKSKRVRRQRKLAYRFLKNPADRQVPLKSRGTCSTIDDQLDAILAEPKAPQSHKRDTHKNCMRDCDPHGHVRPSQGNAQSRSNQKGSASCYVVQGGHTWRLPSEGNKRAPRQRQRRPRRNYGAGEY